MDDLIERMALCASLFPLDNKDAADIYKLIMDAPAVNRWIPVSERMPEKDTSVIIYAAGHRVSAYYDATDGVFRLTEENGLFYRKSAVTHWMMMPEPPVSGVSEDV